LHIKYLFNYKYVPILTFAANHQHFPAPPSGSAARKNSASERTKSSRKASEPPPARPDEFFRVCFWPIFMSTHTKCFPPAHCDRCAGSLLL